MAVEKSRKALFIALSGILVIAAAVIAVVLYSGGDEPTQQSSSADKINIEVRANPRAEIRVDGKKIGKTPINLQFAKSDKEILIEATLERHYVKRGGAKKDEIFKGTRRLTLDRDRVVDFTYDNSELIDTKETGGSAASP
jgi:hypothetical protein